MKGESIYIRRPSLLSSVRTSQKSATFVICRVLVADLPHNPTFNIIWRYHSITHYQDGTVGMDRLRQHGARNGQEFGREGGSFEAVDLAQPHG
jgi:hypothetical protein